MRYIVRVTTPEGVRFFTRSALVQSRESATRWTAATAAETTATVLRAQGYNQTQVEVL